MKKILITGANGYLGKFCVNFLKGLDFEIHAISTKEKTDSELIWHKLNLHDHEQTNALISQLKPEYLIHLAWYTKPGLFWSSSENFIWKKSSDNLIHSFYSNRGLKAVSIGSCAEYESSENLCNEKETSLKPNTIYGICKNELHNKIRRYSENYKKSYAWIRIFNLYGLDEPKEKLIPSTILSLNNNEFALCSHGNQIRDFLHVRDAANAIIKILNSSYSGPINVGSGEAVSVKTVVNIVAEILKKKNLVKFGHYSSRIDEPNFIVADTYLLENIIGWQKNYSLEAGLKESIDYWSNKDLRNTLNN